MSEFSSSLLPLDEIIQQLDELILAANEGIILIIIYHKYDSRPFIFKPLLTYS